MARYDVLTASAERHRTILSTMRNHKNNNSIFLSIGKIDITNRHLTHNETILISVIPKDIVDAFITATQKLEQHLQENLTACDKKLRAIETILKEGESDE